MAAATPALGALATAGIVFSEHRYTHDPAAPSYGLEAAEALGLPVDRVFKTLLLLVDGAPHVAIVPVACQLDLKRAAIAVGGKRAEMMNVDAAERLTGYIAGGISPFGQKRRLPTIVDETAELHDVMYVSGGRRGLDIGLSPDDLIRVLTAIVADIAR
jgi:Cys-tRNA(Pro)/Cys-tRNA(Cys) deacylase